MRIFASIIKRDDEKRMVYGYASTEAMDSQGERVSKAAIEAALPDYMRWANVREMHQASAVGVTKSAEIDDKGLYIQAKIVDEAAWQKVKEEVYKGFSIGGKSIAKTDETITELKLTEISLVDRPANAEAVIELWKSADGTPAPVTPEQKAAIEKLATLVNGGQISPEQLLELAEGAVSKRQFSDKKRKELAGKGHALPDGSFPIENTGDLKNAIKAFGRAKDKAKAKAHIIARAKDLKATNLLPADWRGSTKEEGDGKAAGAEDVRKGLYQVSWLANLLDTISCLQAENSWEAEREGDNSEVPAQLKDWLEDGTEILAAMCSEECAELMGVAEARTPEVEVIENAAGVDDLVKLVAVLRKAFPATAGEKQDTPEFARAELARRAADAIEKAGAKFSAGTRAKLKEAHGHVKKAAGHMAKARDASVAEADGHLDKCEKCIDKADETMESLGYEPREGADDDDESGQTSRGGKDQKGKVAAGDALTAALTPDALTKAQADFAAELAKRDNTITELTKRLKALEDQPLPAKGPTRAVVVDKSQDNGSGNGGTPAIEPVLNADGTVDEAATAMKKAQATPTFVRTPSAYYRPRTAR